MISFRSAYKRLIPVIALVCWFVAHAMAQDGIVVIEDETKTLKVENHVGSTYIWYLYNEPTFKNLATKSEANIISGENSPSITIKWLKPGIYFPTVVETNQLGCSNTKAIALVVNGRNTVWPIVRISNQTVLIGNSKFILSNSCRPTILDASSSTGEELTYLWEPSTNLDNPKSSTPKFSPGKTTTYTLTVTDKYGHTGTETVGIKVSAEARADAGEIMFMRVNQSGMLDGSKSTGDNLIYSWQAKPGRIVSGGSTTHPVIDQPGKYYLTVTDQYGCSDVDSVWVNWYIQAVKDTIRTDVNLSAELNVLKNDYPKNQLNLSTLRILTQPKNGLATVLGDSLVTYAPNQYFIGTDEFEYSICDFYKHCENAKVLVLINDVPFFIPEAFSPNGDDINDRFEIKGLAKYKTVELEIFNRWGNVVYRSGNYGSGAGKSGFWDGNAQSGLRIGSGPVPSGIYYYILKLDGKESMNGSVYLDR